MATPLAPSEIQVAYMNSATPYTLLYVQKIPRFLARNWNLCNFGSFLPKFGCHGNSLNSFENSGSTFEFTKPAKPYYTCEKFLDVLQGMEICESLAFCLNLVAMTTDNSFGSFEVLDRLSYLKSPTPTIWLFMRKIPRFLAENWNQCIFAYFCTNSVAMATPLTPVKFYAAYLHSLAPKTLLFMR